MIRTAKVSVTTTGSAGAATGTGKSKPINGEVFALYIDWNASAPGTSDIDVVIESDDDRPEVVLYSKDNANADGWVYPVVQSTDTAGAAVAGQYQHLLAAGPVKVTIDQCDALDPAATVYVFYREW